MKDDGGRDGRLKGEREGGREGQSVVDERMRGGCMDTVLAGQQVERRSQKPG